MDIQHLYYGLHFIILVAIAAGTVGATIFGFYKGWKKIREQESERLQKEQIQLLEVLQKEVEAWKLKAEREHDEFKTYRENSHLKINEAQAMILKLSTENAELKHKTDITPVLQIQQQMLKMMERMNEVLTRLEERLASAKV